VEGTSIQLIDDLGDIRQSAETDKISGAIVSAQAKLKPVEKGGTNTHHKYQYATLEGYITAVQPVLARFDLGVLTSVTEQKKDGQLTTVKIAIRLIHASGQWVEVTCYGTGMDGQDKGIYKAITGARKYGIATLLGLVTTDDPESYADTPDMDVDKLAAAFAKVGVSRQRLEMNLGRPLSQITPGSFEDLRGKYKAISEGAKADDVFPPLSGVGISAGVAPTNPRATVESSPQPKSKAA
jgi:hypothetical protein